MHNSHCASRLQPTYSHQMASFADGNTVHQGRSNHIGGELRARLTWWVLLHVQGCPILLVHQVIHVHKAIHTANEQFLRMKNNAGERREFR